MKLFACLLGLVIVAGCAGEVDADDLLNSSQNSAVDENSDDSGDESANNDSSNNDDSSDASGSDDTSADEAIPTIFPKDGFCNEDGASWAWCEDFDGQGASGPAEFDPASSAIDLHIHSMMTMTGTMCETSGDCSPYVEGGSLFLNAEDSGFAMDVLRVQQPFDFEDREGRVHYRSSMQAHSRMHQDIHISPTISNMLPDLRFVTKPLIGDAIDIDCLGEGGQPFTIVVWRNGAETPAYLAHANGPLGITSGVQQDIDVYVTRTRLRVALDGKEVFNSDEHSDETTGAPFPDVGFERGYVHFAQLAYNPVKQDPEYYTGDAPNTFLWDNLAFDGLSLAKNSLTPVGKKEVLFRAWNKSACSARGIEADGPIDRGFFYNTWHVQIGADDLAVTASDISCAYNLDSSGQPDLYPAPNSKTDIGDILYVER